MLSTRSASRTEVLATIEQIRPVIERHREENEQNRSLSGAVVEAIKQAGLLDLWVPREYGGREVDLPVFMEATETLAQIDSAAGWIFSTGAAGALMTAFLPAETAREAGLLGEAGMDPKVIEALTTPQPVEFAATWAFVLEDQPGGGTRLIERFRVRFGETNQPWARHTLPFVGFGLFVFVRKQLLNIKARAEGTAPVGVPETETLPA